MLTSYCKPSVWRRVVANSSGNIKNLPSHRSSCLTRTMDMFSNPYPSTSGTATTTKNHMVHSYSIYPVAKKFITKFNLPDHTNRITPSLTKVVATIGPTSEQELPLQKVVDAGMNIMRLNFSHATHEEVELRVSNLQKAITKLYDNRQYVGILLDTKGPEIRTGKLQNDVSGHDTITLQQGSYITLHTDETTRDNGSTATDMYIDFAYLANVVSVGNQVLFDDGACILTVTDKDVTKGTVTCLIQNTASLRSRAGVNLPLADTSAYLPALSDKDKADILYGMSTDVDIDFVAASFVQSAQGVREIREYIEQCAKQLNYNPTQQRPLIISKIETASSLEHFDDILEESDAIMVARGDLGVEIPLQQVTNAQKEMIAACNAAGKPCIVATQMLESMTKNPRPTRAEVADVTNAVYDGADAVMTSGETAKGKYPAETIDFMQNILISAEEYYADPTQHTVHQHPFNNYIPNTPNAVVAAAAVTAANRTADCQAIVVLDAKAPKHNIFHDNLATLVAAYRPTRVPIIAVCKRIKTARQLSLYRGIRPVIVDGTAISVEEDDLLRYAKELHHLESGKPVVIVSSGLTSSSPSNMKISLIP